MSADVAATSGTRPSDVRAGQRRDQVGHDRRQLAQGAGGEDGRAALVVLRAVQPAVGERLGQHPVDDLAVGVGGPQRSGRRVTRVVRERTPHVPFHKSES